MTDLLLILTLALAVLIGGWAVRRLARLWEQALSQNNAPPESPQKKLSELWTKIQNNTVRSENQAGKWRRTVL